MRIHKLIFFTLLLVTFACKTQKPVSEAATAVVQQETSSPALLRFGDVEVSKAEFERVYQKNNGGYEAVKHHTPEQYREYLDLYINFKRKVMEAEALGLHETAAFKQEFETYRKQLAQPYLSAKEVEEKIVKEAYERSKWIINADHLLVNLPQDASPEDTLRAYQRIMAYRDSIVSGARSFAYMAEKYSQDPSAKQNKGNLGYFTVFDMVYPFETAAYTTPPGQVSMPVRTQFGYHLVKVNEKLPSPGQKHAAHIIVRIGDRYSAKDTAQAQAIIQELYEQLKAGADFAELARKHSDDPNSARNGGDLGTGRLLPEMEARKLKLGAGEFSEPFTTAFGWHILAVTKIDTLPPFEEARASLLQRISRDSRSQISKTALLQRIKDENNYRAFPENFEAFKATLDANFPRGNWTPDTTQKELYHKPLFSLGDDYTATVQDLIDYYQQGRIRHFQKTPAQAADAVLKSFEEQELLKYEEKRLPEKNPEFRHLVQEYRDGILLFTLMEQKVWKKAVEDTLGLKQYYDTHPDSFMADVLIDVKEYRSTEPEVIQQVKSLLEAGKTEQEIDSLINDESSLRLRITQQTYEKGKSDLPDEIFEHEPGYQTDILKQDDFYRILIIEKTYPAGIKPFEKAKSECITQYQDYLEKQWLAELAEKYPVEINEQAFAKLFQ
ncbi:MAG: peptidylprolyl isomerase [Bacteroidetes bacterium]|nr:MAG: peptidylprolyl isomerase [Bacteroidota bacterium]